MATDATSDVHRTRDFSKILGPSFQFFKFWTKILILQVWDHEVNKRAIKTPLIRVARAKITVCPNLKVNRFFYFIMWCWQTPTNICKTTNIEYSGWLAKAIFSKFIGHFLSWRLQPSYITQFKFWAVQRVSNCVWVLPESSVFLNLLNLGTNFSKLIISSIFKQGLLVSWYLK